MKVLVDRSVWSLALGRRKAKGEDAGPVDELGELIREGRAAIIGPIRQEILSGLFDARQHRRVKERLCAFEDIPLSSPDHEEAARLHNVCRTRGVHGSHVDFIIAAVALRADMPIFTSDQGFARFARHFELTLHQVRK